MMDKEMETFNAYMDQLKVLRSQRPKNFYRNKKKTLDEEQKILEPFYKAYKEAIQE